MRFVLITIVSLLMGCVDPSQYPLGETPKVQSSPNSISDYEQLDGKKMTIAVYSFADKTGQRKPGNSSLSSAVTQGAEVWVIKALQDVGKEKCQFWSLNNENCFFIKILSLWGSFFF